MKKLAIVLFLMTCTAGVWAQADVPLYNINVLNNHDETTGRFEHSLNERERVQVSFALTPKHPVDVALFTITTAQVMPFSASITDASGKTVYNWKPQQQSYYYKADWNIGALKSGTYTVKIFLENKSIHEFQFSKN